MSYDRKPILVHPECTVCGGFGEMDPWGEGDEVPCVNPHCDLGCDTSKPRVPAPDKIAEAIEMARGYDGPPSTPVLFEEASE